MATKRSVRPDIFLCHSKGDKPFVRKLAQHLAELSVKPWLDEWEIAPGHSLHELIGKAIRSSKYLGFVLSPLSVRSKWCMGELREALSLEKITNKEKAVIPLRHREAPMPPFLVDKKYCDFSSDYFSALAELAGRLRDLDQKQIAVAISNKRPKSVKDVRDMLNNIDDGIYHIGLRDWLKIETILRSNNLKIGDTVRWYDDVTLKWYDKKRGRDTSAR